MRSFSTLIAKARCLGLSVCFSVCMNALISVTIRVRATKFGTKFAASCTQLKFIQNSKSHTHRLSKSIISLYKELYLVLLERRWSISSPGICLLFFL